jgi:hypothetical protein
MQVFDLPETPDEATARATDMQRFYREGYPPVAAAILEAIKAKLRDRSAAPYIIGYLSPPEVESSRCHLLLSYIEGWCMCEWASTV